MTSAPISIPLSAQEILQSLDELDEETNLSFNTQYSMNDSNNKDINNHKKSICLSSSSSSLLSLESSSSTIEEEFINNHHYYNHCCNESSSVNSNNDAITVQMSNTRSSQLKKQVEEFRSNSLARSLSRLSKSQSSSLATTAMATKTLKSTSKTTPKLTPKLKTTSKNIKIISDCKSELNSNSNNERSKLKVTPKKATGNNSTTTKQLTPLQSLTNSRTLLNMDSNNIVSTATINPKEGVTKSLSEKKEAHLEVEATLDVLETLAVAAPAVTSTAASPVVATTTNKITINDVVSVKSNESVKSDNSSATNPATSVSSSTPPYMNEPTPPSSPSPMEENHSNTNDTDHHLLHFPLQKEYPLLQSPSTLAQLSNCHYSQSSYKSISCKSTSSNHSDDVTTATACCSPTTTASTSMSITVTSSFESPARTKRLLLQKEVNHNTSPSAFLSQTSSPLSSSFHDKGDNNILMDNDDEFVYHYDDNYRNKFNSSPSLFEYDKYDIPATSTEKDEDQNNNDDEDEMDEENDELIDNHENTKGKLLRKMFMKSLLKEEQQQSKHETAMLKNPTGMVISTSEFCYDKEAILDPTWLDSVDNDDDDNNEFNTHDNVKQEIEQPQQVALDTTLMTKLSNSQSVVQYTSSSSTTTSNSSKYLSGDSRCDNKSVSSKSLSIASSLSVGSCGFGKISLGESGLISLGSEIDDGSNSDFSYADVVDMGVASVKDAIIDARSIRSKGSNSSSSYGSSQGHVIDRLYDMERLGYGSDSDSELSCDDVDSNSNSHHSKHLSDLPSVVSGKDDDCEEQSKEYLQSSYLVTPPRVIRQADHQSSLPKPTVEEDSSDDEENASINVIVGHTKNQELANETTVQNNTISENEFDILDPVIEVPSRNINPAVPTVNDVSIDSSTSDDTNHLYDKSASKPFSLDHKGLAGLVKGDLVISIIDCPGKRTRRKRGARSLSIRSGNFNTAFVGEFNWCHHSVQLSVHMIRKLRIGDCNQGDNLTYDDFCKSTLSPLQLGRSLVSSNSQRRNCVLSNNSTRSPSNSFSIGSDVKKGQSRCQRLERDAIHFLEADDFESALSNFEEILSIYANRMDNCFRYGDSIDESNLHVATTLHNIGIIHFLTNKFEESIELLERAMNMRESIEDNAMIDESDKNASFMMVGLAYYAIADFQACKLYWNKALKYLRKAKENSSTLMIELLNNLGCLHYETGNEATALKFFQQSLDLQRHFIISEVYDDGKGPCKHMLIKLAVTQANIGYIHFRLKNSDAAIASFKQSQKDFEIVLDVHHPFCLSVLDYLALAYLQNGDKNNAISIYSKMLTAQIVANEGGDNVECSQTLIKLNMLQAKKKDRRSIRACLQKVKEFIRENRDPCQYERMEKLLKLSGVVFV